MRETAGEPYHKEVATCEQLTFYLAKFTAPAAAAAAAGGGGAAPAAPPEGYKVFKKADIEDDGILALSGGAKKGGKKARGRAGERKDDKPVRPRGSERRVVCWARRAALAVRLCAARWMSMRGPHVRQLEALPLHTIS